VLYWKKTLKIVQLAFVVRGLAIFYVWCH